ncbi:ArsR family transcriptional regulator [Pararobbsia silviterrae]|uniref:ArsR family transcriptional regulator n=1 Tax=Pararobbsia silviterrae TaxID=1792498 RepID=A0A494X2X7_9BURK|nr:ArsR family transcriptional regulator [Pararobbsia silviterrae]RKP45048.1 ArsR family transcriptional regulator [Pararobbsia silviterrae]
MTPDRPREPARSSDPAGADEIDPAIAAVLSVLWETANDPSGKLASLARLGKRTQLAQSALRRYLTALSDAGLVSVALDEAGLGSAALTALGRTICEDLFGPPDRA